MNFKQITEQLQKFLIQEMAWKTGCRVEITPENTKEISDKYNLKPITNLSNIQQKAS